MKADNGRYKRVIGAALHSRTKGRQTAEVTIAVAALNPHQLGRPEYVRLARMDVRGADFAQLPLRATQWRGTAKPLCFFAALREAGPYLGLPVLNTSTVQPAFP